MIRGAMLALALFGCAPAPAPPCALLAQARAITNEQWDENALLIHRLTVATGESTAAGSFEGGYPYTRTGESLRAFQLRLDAYARECGCPQGEL